ncbi:hypothetical protein QQF64_009844 [Cirrhinus molitorella]|uniref:Uncharacterized protein n=2 Tax=Cirrhinus molitorella TaxID=172907 RepID=A0ABR3M299_9TELE|nr:hypothetical protein Q8A67_007946 [Cirrhinus molitorella]
MTRSAAFIVVALLLCIVLLSEASDNMQCTGERQSDGQFFFHMSHAIKEDVSDCETQWLVDEKVAGLFEADGYTKFMPPLAMVTANTTIVQTCPKRLECLLICPSANVRKKMQCSCDNPPPTTLPEVDSPKWNMGVVIGVSASVILLVSVIVTIVLCKKKQRSEYDQGRALETVAV